HQEQLTFGGHSHWVMGVAFSPGGKQVASASSMLFGALGEIKVWDRATGKVLHTLLALGGPLVGVAFSPDGKLLASAGWDPAGNCTRWAGTPGRSSAWPSAATACASPPWVPTGP